MKLVSEPSLRDVLNLLRDEIMLSLNCHAVGVIQEFNAEKQLASVSIGYKKSFQDSSGKITAADYPVLLDCPVVVMRGGKGGLTFPIAPGDSCLILFNDRDMDTWINSGQVTVPSTARKHSIADAIAIVGISNGLTQIAEYEADRVRLYHDAVSLELKGQKAKLANDTASLYDILNSLSTALNTFATAASAATPANVTATVGTPAAALAGQLATITTKIGALLE